MRDRFTFTVGAGYAEGDHENFPIGEVLEHYGWDGLERGYSAWRKVHCPFHIDRTPSGAINHELNSYRCFSCDAKGNSVTLVMHVEGVSQDEAVRILKERGHDAAPELERASRKAVRLPWEPAHWWN